MDKFKRVCLCNLLSTAVGLIKREAPRNACHSLNMNYSKEKQTRDSAKSPPFVWKVHPYTLKTRHTQTRAHAPEIGAWMKLADNGSSCQAPLEWNEEEKDDMKDEANQKAHLLKTKQNELTPMRAIEVVPHNASTLWNKHFHRNLSQKNSEIKFRGTRPNRGELNGCR